MKKSNASIVQLAKVAKATLRCVEVQVDMANLLARRAVDALAARGVSGEAALVVVVVSLASPRSAYENLKVSITKVRA
jgi:hypothetical protein